MPDDWPQTRLRILTRDQWLCRLCGAWANTVDHVIPRAAGGTDDDWNLRALCMPCHRRRTGEVHGR
jgi:5-methylcytosine-specific restriction protein A